MRQFLLLTGVHQSTAAAQVLAKTRPQTNSLLVQAQPTTQLMGIPSSWRPRSWSRSRARMTNLSTPSLLLQHRPMRVKCCLSSGKCRQAVQSCSILSSRTASVLVIRSHFTALIFRRLRAFMGFEPLQLHNTVAILQRRSRTPYCTSPRHCYGQSCSPVKDFVGHRHLEM